MGWFGCFWGGADRSGRSDPPKPVSGAITAPPLPRMPRARLRQSSAGNQLSSEPCVGSRARASVSGPPVASYLTVLIPSFLILKVDVELLICLTGQRLTAVRSPGSGCGDGRRKAGRQGNPVSRTEGWREAGLGPSLPKELGQRHGHSAVVPRGWGEGAEEGGRGNWLGLLGHRTLGLS